MALDWRKTFDNKFNIEFDDQDKCKKCGRYHKLNVKEKLIADCNGNFDPAQHKEYINSPQSKTESTSSGEFKTGEEIHDWNWALDQIESGEKVCQEYSSNKNLYLAKDPNSSRILFYQDGIPNSDFGQGVELTHMRATDWKLWRSVEDIKLTCKLEGKELMIYNDDDEGSPCMFIPLTKKEVKSFKEFREKLL